MNVKVIAILVVGFAALSTSKAAPILVSGTAIDHFDYSLAGSFGRRLFFSGTNGVDSIIITSQSLGASGIFITFGSLNGSGFSSDSSFALGGGGGFVRIGAITLPLQSYLTFSHQVFFDTTPTRASFENHYLISSAEPVPEPSSVILGLLGIVALALLKVKGDSGESPTRG